MPRQLRWWITRNEVPRQHQLLGGWLFSMCQNHELLLQTRRVISLPDSTLVDTFSTPKTNIHFFQRIINIAKGSICDLYLRPWSVWNVFLKNTIGFELLMQEPSLVTPCSRYDKTTHFHLSCTYIISSWEFIVASPKSRCDWLFHKCRTYFH